MRITLTGVKSREQGNMIILCLVMVTVIMVAAGIATLVVQSSKVTLSRSNTISAIQYAQAAAVIGASDLNTAITSSTNTFIHALTSANYTGSGTTYQRTLSAPFSNQTATVRMVLSSSSSPNNAQITGSATVGGVTQTATLNVKLSWAFPAAIVSVNAGTTSTSNAKSSGQDGNVAVNGQAGSPIVINGGVGDAVLANGMVDYDTNYVHPPASAYSATNWGTANQIPDYTAQGSSNSLFDLNRFIAVADQTTNQGYSPSGNNHFTNISDFMVAMNNYSNPFTKAMEGVVVVDVSQDDKNMNSLTTSDYKQTTTITAAKTDKKTGITTPASTNTVATGGLPFGINVHGTLLLNFTGTGWDPVSEKIVVTAAFNINAANLSGLVAATPSTYTTGYPPTYVNTNHDPVNVIISNVVDVATGQQDFQQVQQGDDLPALIYSTGCLDMHGNADICGVLYTPCYVELENKGSGDTQYINGCVIMGHGIYYENTQNGSTSIITFDANTVDSLDTFGSAGKAVAATYWQP